jgi:murein DD-endopeptidase MepM/ murein hydrolase activator NlpD
MPHRSRSHSPGHHQTHSDSVRRPAPPGSRGPIANCTLVIAGHQVRLGPVAFWIAIGTLVIMAAWTLTTATYFAFRDDVLTRLITRQAEMQFGYEDRIAELRAEVDRMSSRQLLDQEQFEQKLDAIVRRQSALESRAATLNGFPDSMVTGSTKPVSRGEPARPTSLKPSPIKDSAAPAARYDRRTELPVDAVLARLQASLDRVEARQTANLTMIEQSYGAKARRIHGILAEFGMDPAKIAHAGEATGTGGPFVPARLRPDAGPFDRQVYHATLARIEFERLTRSLGNVPVRKPIASDADPMSPFGIRIDPFVHSPAMHTGLDLAAQMGDPVRATANGKVVIAGWQGGYGRMVEIDHGNGLATRYGHLSSIEVGVGQSVKIGQVIGRVGTTGRSTGPHLHYETRIDGEATDPQKFLRAGSRLAGII